MGKSKPVIINGIFFSSKNSLTEHIRKMIAGYAIGEDVNGLDHDFCLALFQFHPDSKFKLLSGVKRVEVRIDAYRNKHFQVHLNNGTDDDISWPWCVRHAH